MTVFDNKKINIAILGATGSIGKQVREILSDEYIIKLVAADKRGKELSDDFCGYKETLRIYSNSSYEIAQEDKNIHFFSTKALSDAKTYEGIDIVVNGISGFNGIAPSFAVLESGARLVTANKETFVAAGGLFMRLADKLGAKIGERILPIDSEHSAVWGCLAGESFDSIQKIVLTASGGAFRDLSKKEIAAKKAIDALNNPNWKMGKKVTVDTATLMNKGFELLEARHLFGTTNVSAIIHRESIIHAVVTFKDGTSKLLFSKPDMRLPIQYALTHPSRKKIETDDIINPDIFALSSLEFSYPDKERFPCYALAEQVLKADSDYLGAVLCIADEIAVDLYLNVKIGFYGISDIISSALNRFKDGKLTSLTDLWSIENEVREYIICNFGGDKC